MAVGYYITPALLGGPKDTMIALLIADQIIEIGNWKFGATIAVILFTVVILFLTIAHFYLGLNRIFAGFQGRRQ
jgi:ABC-type spermidine/putrescine transport system permease subunit I